ncbi:MAG: hypothetical protein HWD86_10655 [Kangiellaceae bacterium]|nr:hypothetical protein [Kangiellaceae bacterium]
MKLKKIGLTIALTLGTTSVIAANPFSNEMDHGKKLQVWASDKAYHHIEANPANRNIKLFELESQQINQDAQSIELEIDGNFYQFDISDFSQSGSGSQIIKANIRGKSNSANDALNSAIFVRNGNKVTANIRMDGELYSLRPLSNGGHALMKVDESLMPQDHPAEFDSIRQRSERLQKGKPGGNNPPDPGNEPDPGPTETIRVMVHYTPAAASASGDINGLIDLAMAETNQGYANSNVTINLQLAGKYMVNYTESGSFSTDLSRYREFDGVMDEIHSTRDQVSADVGVLLINNASSCGLASSIGSTAATAFANAHWDCATGYYSFGHEIGHLQSARHDPRTDSSTTPYAYGHGYQYSNGGWRTIMAYNCKGRTGCTRINYWSNPYVTYNGVPMGTVDQSHNSRVLNETKSTLAAFR